MALDIELDVEVERAKGYGFILTLLFPILWAAYVFKKTGVALTDIGENIFAFGMNKLPIVKVTKQKTRAAI